MAAGAFDQATLIQTCGFAVAAVEGTVPRSVNIFDTFDIRSNDPKDDSDLGSPNQGCGGPGIGEGGAPDADFPNCVAQGNALIIQDPAVTDRPNDNVDGGCFLFNFMREIELINMFMLDVDERDVTIKVRTIP
jgi:hypothetical protein